MADTDSATRTVTRRKPVQVVIERTEQVFEAHPLFWRDRHDLGAAIASEYTRATNGAQSIEVIKDSHGVDVLQWNFVDIAYDKLLHMAYPEVKNGAFEKLGYDELVGLMLAALEVNGLQRFDWMVDPTKKDALSTLMERAEAEAPDNGQKMPSSTAASSPESTPISSG